MENRFSPRFAAFDDVPALVEIEKKVHPSPHGKWTEEHFRAELEKPYSKIWVLTDDDTDSAIAGYIVVWMIYEECQILNLAVDLPFRGLGYAQILVRLSVDYSLKSGLKRMILDVRRGNLPAIQLYQKLRFSIVHVRKKFYTDGEDAYQMALPLEGHPVIEF